jgi:hypothetical protein
MKLAVQYLNDAQGKTNAVQLSITEWKKLMDRVKKYEQSLKLKADLAAAIAEVHRKSKTSRKQNLTDFLNEL